MPPGLVFLTIADAEVELNGKELKLGAGDTIPAIKGVATGGAPGLRVDRAFLLWQAALQLCHPDARKR